MYDFSSLKVTVDGGVATIEFRRLGRRTPDGPVVVPHIELPEAIQRMRVDPAVRVIVLTGEESGEFLSAGPPDLYRQAPASFADPYASFAMVQGVFRTFQALVETEKPIIAKLNGDAIGFGQSVMFGCDFILAREDARISDVHLAMGTALRSADDAVVGLPFGVAPGDGGGALVPLFLPPTLAKEYLMLGRVHTARDLEKLGVVNRAVPVDDLDATTKDFVDELLARPAFALAWAKRIANRRVADQLNLTLDASVAYEQMNFMQIHNLGADDPQTSFARDAG